MYCTCCGALYDRAGKPQDPNLDRGFGRCAGCQPRLVDSALRFGLVDSIDALPTEAERRAAYEALFARFA